MKTLKLIFFPLKLIYILRSSRYSNVGFFVFFSPTGSSCKQEICLIKFFLDKVRYGVISLQNMHEFHEYISNKQMFIAEILLLFKI